MILAYKNKKKISAFVKGCNAAWATPDDIQNNTQHPMIFSGVTTTMVLSQARCYNLDYYYIDTGYFGNAKKKNYLRVTKNAYHNWFPIVERPRDRLDVADPDLTEFRRGNRILLVPPDSKICTAMNLGDPEQWITDTVALIQQYTDREIVVRRRTMNRTHRLVEDTFVHQLQQDINAVVVYTSNCAVESAMHNIPVVSLGRTGATQICPFEIQQIDSLPDIDSDLKESWLRHLSYSQFTQDEMLSGLAWAIVSTQQTVDISHHSDFLHQSSVQN
jgi:hypothetical protein